MPAEVYNYKMKNKSGQFLSEALWSEKICEWLICFL